MAAENGAAGHAEVSTPAASASPAAHVEASAPEVHSGPAAATPLQPSRPSNPTPAPAHVAEQGTSQTQRQTGADSDHRDHHRNSENGVYYNDPWWGSGYWNGQNFNTGTYNDASYTPDGSVTNGAGTSNANSAQDQPAPAPTTPEQSSPGAQAQLDNDVEKSPALVAANNDVQLAQVAYDNQRERVLAGLTTQPNYQQALARQHNSQDSLHEAKATATTSPAVIEAATAKLDASDEVTKMQEQAVAIDPAASQAKIHLAEAVAHRDELRARLLAQH